MLLSGIGLAEWFHAVAADREVGGFDRHAFEAWTAAQHNPRQLSVNSFWLAEHIAGSDADGSDLWFWWYGAFNAAADRR